MCRTITYLGEEGVEGLRPNLTAIGLLDVPQLNDMRRPLLCDNLNRLVEDLQGQLHRIQRNQVEVQSAVDDLSRREKAEILKIQTEFDWVMKLMRMRLQQHVSSIESAFAIDKNLLLAKYEALQCVEMTFTEQAETITTLLNDDNSEPTALIRAKQISYKLLKDKASAVDVSSILSQSKRNVEFFPSYYSRLVNAVLLFGTVDYPAKAQFVKSIDCVTRVVNFDLKGIQAAVFRLCDYTASSVSVIRSGMLQSSEMLFRGLSLILGCRESTIREVGAGAVACFNHLLFKHLYIPSITLWRLVSTTWVDFVLTSLFTLLRNEKSLLHEPHPFSEPVLSVVGAVSRLSGISALILNGIGYDSAQLKRLGYSAHDLRETGLSDPMVLKRLGYGPRELFAAGFFHEELLSLGFAEFDLILGRH